MNEIETKMIGTNLKIAIVAGRFNDFITSRLVEGAEGTLISHDVKSDDRKPERCQLQRSGSPHTSFN